MDIAEQSVPSTPAGGSSPYTRRTWLVLGLVVGSLLLATLAAGWFYKVPYYGLLPGSARDTEGLIAVEGAETYASEGDLYYTTVRVRGRLSLWEYLWLRQDDDAAVVPEAAVLGDRDRNENRQYNLQLMDNSKQVAVAVALEQLGYDVTDATGVLVLSIVEDTAAFGVLDLGDVIVAIDGEPISDAPQLVEALSASQPGDTVTLTVQRHSDGGQVDVEVTLGEHPSGTGGFLGIGPSTRIDFEPLPFDVRIDTGEVGGPSAGLAFTLAILDDLTPGELTGGQQVAVTGTIAVDGTVGPVGGVPQKAAAVRDAGIDVFLVPSALGEEEIERVRDRAGDGLEIVPVDDVEQAIAALSAIGGEVDTVAAGELVPN